MSLLSALLVRDRVVPPPKLDEAIQRQVINGGDFETNLLEVGAIAEDTLAGYCAAVHDALAVSRDEVMTADPAVVKKLSRDVAEEHRVLPVRVEGGRVVLAAVTPPGPEARALLESLLGAQTDVRVTTAFRLACGLSRAYGTELSPRFRRLAQRIGGTPSGEMVAVATPSNIPVPVKSNPPPTASGKLQSALAALSAALEDERESAVPPRAEGAEGLEDEGPEIETVEDEGGEAPAGEALRADALAQEGAHERGQVPEPEPEPEQEQEQEQEYVRGPGAGAVDDVAGVAELSEADFLHDEGASAAETGEDGRTTEIEPARTTEIERPPAARPSPDAARARIREAADRDAVIAALLGHASAVLSYAALFVVQRDVAEGLDARGAGLDGEAVRKIAVPLDAPGSFRAVRERGGPVIGALGDARTDAVIQADLARRDARGVALIPVHIGGRVALILWADNGPAALDLSAVDEITDLCGEAARAFERLIVQRKRAQGVSLPRRAPVTDATRVTAGDIERRVAEQRGVQALRALASQRASVPSSALSAGGGAEEEPARGAGAAPDEREAPAASGEVRRESTRFARGGRVPISVDVIGHFPEPALVGEGQPRTRGFDPRREPESPAEPLDAAGPRGAFPFATSAPAATPVEPGDEVSRAVAEIVDTGVMSDAAANLLLGAGERALAAVFRQFPGPTRHDRTAAQTRLPPVGEIGALLRLVVMFRQASGPHLVEQLESPVAEHRYYATLCLGDVLYPPALPYLLSRLFDQDFPTRVVAVEVLRAYRRFPEFEQVVRTLRAIVSEHAAPPDRRRTAANVLGELRDAEAVPALIVALGESDGALSGVARRSLVVISRQDFGEAPHAWRDWWERAAGYHRIEWLMEGLLHGEPSIRHEASEELKKLTGQFFGYYFNLPRREREKAYQRYREWWQREGRAQFSR